ncbi:MAG: ATP-binding protein [Saprospiraceae bacterium]|nr:ATP-binding protein [Saprospiraceae bacterium]
MDKLRQEHNQFLQNLVTSFHREIQREIGWDERLLFIKGARGVGKTTLILQYIKQTYDFDTKALYVSMDSLNTANYTLLDIAKQHSNLGGTHLFIDEIHKYDRWSIELKNIYDLYQNLHVVVSGLSILDLYKGNADLSRRAITHVLQGLSLREFLNIQNDLVLQRYTLAEIIKDHVKIVHEILKVTNPLQYFKDYLAYGYYPFYLQGVKYFHQKLNNTINQIIEVDIPTLFNLEVSNISKIKKLLYHIATTAPFQPNSTKLAASLDLNRQTLNTYLQYLQEGQILQLLWDSTKAYSLISKPDKIYLQNPNLCHLVPSDQKNIGSLRETFFMNQVNTNHRISTAQKGDFLVDDIYIFEVGGEKKRFNQIADLPDSYLAIDNELIGTGNKIPLWLFGFLY